ncbi:MAG: hypothetical protein LBS11_12785 [Oscillospiraceae bacterium]|jgi:hypothetical protein|nr:hypothetical protein [Oscillospiraceae bacterium]
MSDTKTNVTPEPTALATLDPTPEAVALPDGFTEIALYATPEPTVVGSATGQNGRNMLLMLAFVILLLAVFTLLDRAKSRRDNDKPEAAQPPGNDAAPLAITAKTVAVEAAGAVNLVNSAETAGEDDDEIAAVIAAVTAMMSEAWAATPVAAEPPPPPDALRVRRVRRNPHGVPTWRRTGIEEQVYSRLS